MCFFDNILRTVHRAAIQSNIRKYLTPIFYNSDEQFSIYVFDNGIAKMLQ